MNETSQQFPQPIPAVFILLSVRGSRGSVENRINLSSIRRFTPSDGKVFGTLVYLMGEDVPLHVKETCEQIESALAYINASVLCCRDEPTED
jgi:hypothetical protein